jgi:antitoxin component YwqK of YwqJK toxin-antitoxin module
MSKRKIRRNRRSNREYKHANKLISIIQTEQTINNDVITYEICHNSDVGKKPLMQPLQKKFLVYQIINSLGIKYVQLIYRHKGGFDSIKDCERAIELSSEICYSEEGWYKSIETTKDENGNTIVNWVKRIKTSYDENDQIINGIIQSFYGNGILSNLKTYKNGILHGIVKSWHENGHLSYEALYQIGKREGYQRVYCKNGELIRESTFQNGKLNGTSTEWEYNLELEKNFVQILNTYKNNELNGISNEWYENGNLKEESNYFEGKRHGEYKYFDIKGNIINYDVFVNGIKQDSQD